MSSEQKPTTDTQDPTTTHPNKTTKTAAVLEGLTATVNVTEADKPPLRRGKETPADDLRSGGAEDETFRAGGSRSPSSSGVKINLNLNINFNLKNSKVSRLLLIRNPTSTFEFGGGGWGN